jgi:hypothetical protein
VDAGCGDNTWNPSSWETEEENQEFEDSLFYKARLCQEGWKEGQKVSKEMANGT